MSPEEREYMTASIRAAVAEAVAPLSQRLTILETQSRTATWWGAALVSPAVAALVAWLVTAFSNRN